MTNYINTTAGSSIAFVAGVCAVLALALVPVAVRAADLPVDSMIYPSYIDSYTPYDDMIYPSYIDSYTPYDDTIYPSYIDSYSSSYGSGYGGGAFFSGGWSPSYYTGGGYSGGGYSSSYSSVFAPTNTCTATNSCNTTTQINAPTNIVTNTSGGGGYSYPVYPPVYQPPVYVPPTPACYTCGCAGYPACSRPIAYQNQPYVTLAAVPYTGLELGPVGTAMYWGFLVLWSLIAAYLIAVKKIQNSIVAWVTGSTTLTTGGSTPSHNAANSSQNLAVQKSSVLPSAAKPAAAGQTFARQDSAPKFAGIDPFIQSQINRAN